MATTDEAAAGSGAGDSHAGGDGHDDGAPATSAPTPPVLPSHVRTALLIAVGVAVGLLLADFASAIILKLQAILVTLVISLFLSFAMEPAVQWMARRGIRRGLGTLLVFLSALLIVAGFVAAMAPLVVDQVRNLVESGPDVLDAVAEQARQLPGDLGRSVSDWILRQAETLPDRLPNIAGEVGRGVVGVGTTLLGGVVQFLTILLVTFFLVADGPKLRRTLSSRLAPERQREFLQVWELAIAKTGGYVYSRVLTAIVSAVVHIVAFTVIGLDYSAALGVWVGIISSLIPVVGTYIAGALPLVIGLSVSVTASLAVLAVIVVYQQVENYLVAPRITAATMELHPAVAFLSVLVGASLLGAPGALLALPAAAIVAALVSAYGERHEVMEHGLTAHDEETAAPLE